MRILFSSKQRRMRSARRVRRINRRAKRAGITPQEYFVRSVQRYLYAQAKLQIRTSKEIAAGMGY